jgi:flagellar protein FliS
MKSRAAPNSPVRPADEPVVMKTTSPGASAYFKTKVMTASPAELRQMLLDGAIRFAEMAREGLERQDFEAVYTGVTRCQAILMELINSLRPEHNADLCQRLSALYTYMYTRLIKASSEKNAAIVGEVLDLLRFERDTWNLVQAKLVEENAAAAGMQSTPNAVPPVDPALQPKPNGLVGASVSVRG